MTYSKGLDVRVDQQISIQETIEFCMGYSHCKSGGDVTENPYDPETDRMNWLLWHEGFIEAEGNQYHARMAELVRSVRIDALEEAAKAVETGQVSGSLLRPGLAKIVRGLK